MRPNHEGDTICGEVDVILYNNNNPADDEEEDVDDGMFVMRQSRNCYHSRVACGNPFQLLSFFSASN